MPCHPNVKTCTHIKVTGHPCGSPALSGERFCYFHQRMIRGVRTPPKSRIHPMALLESEEGIQVALMETVNAIVRNTIDLKRATLILRALSIAARNSRRVRFDRAETDMVRHIPDYQPAAPESRETEHRETQDREPKERATKERATKERDPQERQLPAAATREFAKQSLPRAEPRGQSLAPHVSAGKALAEGKSPEGTAPSQPARKPAGRVTQAPAAQAQAVNARPQRE